MLINGVYPVRPGKKACAFYINNGWCAYKAKCRCALAWLRRRCNRTAVIA